MIPALARCAGGEDAARSASDHLKGSKAKKEHVGLRKAAPAFVDEAGGREHSNALNTKDSARRDWCSHPVECRVSFAIKHSLCIRSVLKPDCPTQPGTPNGAGALASILPLEPKITKTSAGFRAHAVRCGSPTPRG